MGVFGSTIFYLFYATFKVFMKFLGLDLIADGTERKYFRHKNNKKQKENYSWKKNAIQRKI